MAKYKPQHRRLLFIDRKISEGRYPNCTSLAEEYEVSSKTIQRDLEYMRYELDAPIEYSTKKRGYFYKENRFQLPAISLKESDLFSIYLAEEILNQYKDTPLYDRLKSVFEKIEGSLPNSPEKNISAPQNRFTVFPSPSTTINAKVWDQVFTAVRTQQTIEILYSAPSGKKEKRRIDPYHTIRYEGDWYAVAYCHKQSDRRTFSLARMAQVKETGEIFSIPQDFNFAEITTSRFGIHWSQEVEKIRLLFERQAAPYIEERQWHSSQQIHKMDNGSLELQLVVHRSIELRKWILSWGAQVEVLHPKGLRLEILEEIQKLKKTYST